jgi:hypothetical protein
VASIIVAVIGTFVLTLLGCWKYYSARLEKALTAQEKKFQARFAELIHRLNHTGKIKVGSSLAGLTDITSWAVRNCIMQFVKLRNNKEWNTVEPITELQEIERNELQKIISLVREFILDDRNTLKDFNKDQGL